MNRNGGKPHIYLDHSATTPVAPEVLAAMQPFFSETFGNPASIHAFGRAAAGALDEAHLVVGCAINARASEVVFTGCGSEADNMALRGIALAQRKNGRGGHLVIARAEHHAVETTAEQLRDLFGFDVQFIPVDGCGQVNPDDIAAAIRKDTALVSVMLANNEVGSLNEVSAIGKICKECGVPLHTDAVQAPAYLPLDVNELNCDALSMSSHKIYGPKGVGVLYLREGTPFVPTLTGGGHERGRRAGTVNVAGAVGTAAAIKYVSREREAQAVRLATLRDGLIAGVQASVPQAMLSGHPRQRLPHHASFVFKNVDGESLLMALDVEGIAVSTGSACTSGDPEPSSVLVAMGVPREWALGGLRVTLGYGTTQADVDAFLAVLPKCVERVRKAADWK